MTSTDPHPAFVAAERLAPEPASREDATVEGWARHYAALALAAHAAFRDAERTIRTGTVPGSRPDLGYLAAIGSAATAAAIALLAPRGEVAQTLWDFTPEAGALYREYVDWLAETLDVYGVNPADLYPWFEAGDFRSPSRCEETSRG